jgi:peptidoglycan hydrolase-like protein with peptidoglycan-binding domain
MDLLVDEKLVERLWRRNNFPTGDDGLAFFALRGALPVELNGTAFAASHSVRIPGVDYVHLRCTLGQWSPGRGISVFPGSTVPFLNYIKASLGRGGAGTNMLMLGCYVYERGVHKLGTPTQHRAFRQHGFFPVWRTADDTDYDLSDKLDTSPALVWDDLHAAWCADPSSPHYASAGCQVVAGFPQSPRTNNNPDSGPWALFRKGAYDTGQTLFSYGLFSGAEALSVASLPDDKVRQSLRFGSRGDLVEKLQRSLIAQDFPLSEPDGVFGRETLEAVMAFQQRRFGPGTADGVIGPQTAGALGLDLPSLSDLTGAVARQAGPSQRQGVAPAAGPADAEPSSAEARDAADLIDPEVVRAGTPSRLPRSHARRRSSFTRSAMYGPLRPATGRPSTSGPRSIGKGAEVYIKPRTDSET